MKRYSPKLLLPVIVVLLMVLFFGMLYRYDNKYQTPPPYGRDGVIALNNTDFERGQPLFLIDGWLLSDERVTEQPTYIGKYSNLQRGDRTASPHGKALYQLTLRYSGKDREVVLSFPQLFSAYRIILDGTPIAEGKGSAKLSFTLTEGDHLLAVETTSSHGYYSGLYHPPMLGATNTMFQWILISCIAYGIGFSVPFALALFTLTLWRSSGDKPAFWFGMLCGCFSLYLSYYFVRLLALPFVEWWFLIQSAALYGLCFCVIRLTALAGGKGNTASANWIQRILAGTSVVLLLLALLMPALPQSVRLHGLLTNGYYLFTFCSVLMLVLNNRGRITLEEKLILIACTVFGTGLLLNLLYSNLFEPILFFWQFEWCGLLLVGLFGAMMTVRNKRILAENKAFSEHLEDLVEQRTAELQNLLQERKAFFADMSHDLKAPLYATRSFIDAIRRNDTGVDRELLRYIDQVEQKQQEMTLRVQGLTMFNQMEAVSEPWVAMSVRAMLDEVDETHHMAAEVQSVYLVTEPPELDGLLFVQPKKMAILFENLIYNALRSMPLGGKITIAAELDENECHLTVADTGGGIPLDELPHIFRRFYVGKENKGIGSGLGLTIVKSIVDELHGEISVSSKPGQGAVFYIDLPLYRE